MLFFFFQFNDYEIPFNINTNISEKKLKKNPSVKITWTITFKYRTGISEE